MSRFGSSRVGAVCLGVVLLTAPAAEAGGPFRRYRRPAVVVQPTARAVAMPTSGRLVAQPPERMLGSFYPDPMISIAGNGVIGSGYSPMGMYGPNTLSLDGPLSPFRSTTAPVLTYERGYDGMVRPQTRTSFSYPNRPEVGPIVYPTRANYFWGFRESGTPPQWDRALNWIDQN
jgi:hypothetical protein